MSLPVLLSSDTGDIAAIRAIFDGLTSNVTVMFLLERRRRSRLQRSRLPCQARRGQTGANKDAELLAAKPRKSVSRMIVLD